MSRSAEGRDRSHEDCSRQYITENPLHTFHSFRHGFETALLLADVPLAVMQQLTGHSHESIDLDRYAKGHTAKRLLEEMTKARFGVEDEQTKLKRLA